MGLKRNRIGWGSMLYDKAVVLGPENRIIPFRLKKFYEDDIEFGGEDIPHRYETMEQVRAAGAVVRDVCNIDVLIESDRLPDGAYGFIHDNRAYLAARYSRASQAPTGRPSGSWFEIPSAG